MSDAHDAQRTPAQTRAALHRMQDDSLAAHRTRTNARTAAIVHTTDAQWIGPLDVQAVTVDDEGNVTATLTEVMTPHASTRPQA